MVSLVTGANGLLGRALVDVLLAQGEQVRALDLAPHANSAVESIVADIRDLDSVRRACTGVDVVYHVAALVYLGLGKPRHMYEVNVTGTENIIQACREQGVPRLVYTSSIDVVFEGKPIRNGDESLPYARTHLDYYSETKTLAEQAVLRANDPNGLLTCALRTAGIYGPGDQHRFRPLIAQVSAGGLVRIGDGSSRFSHVYAENAAYAHVLAARALAPGSAVAGQAYFITDHAARNFSDFTVPFLEALGYSVSKRSVPGWLASTVASALALRYRLWPSEKHADVSLTRYSVAALCNDFYFNSEKAQRDFGYRPIVDEPTAYERTLDWLKSVYGSD